MVGRMIEPCIAWMYYGLLCSYCKQRSTCRAGRSE
ncbi:hypothetical protein MTR67_040737 [Solanum verrucosum]|uniref:Uncharacterized protein n=1 Tax=Solanum verrucosum TaxID=315347 RepID=A0AAF0UJT3_SOLVR|nr:hypothetical protein MTR67_040737 [Solanum verrucosum]